MKSNSLFQNQQIQNPNVFKVKLNPSSMLYYNGNIIYLLIGRFRIDEFPNSLKACLISTLPFYKLEGMKCSMRLLYDEKELIAFHGNIFSADDTEKIHSWKSGGLIYPMEIAKLNIDKIDVEVKIFKNVTH